MQAILLWAVVGLAAGWLASKVVASPHGIIVDLRHTGSQGRRSRLWAAAGQQKVGRQLPPQRAGQASVGCRGALRLRDVWPL